MKDFNSPDTWILSCQVEQTLAAAPRRLSAERRFSGTFVYSVFLLEEISSSVCVGAEEEETLSGALSY